MDCKNCNTVLNDADDFCNFCGAKVIRNRLNIKNLFAHFSEHFLNYDNKFLQTFIHLFTKPDAVIGNYINGTRKKHVNVVSYFAIALTISGLQIFFLNKFYPEAIDFSSVSNEATEDFSKKIFDFSIEFQSIMMMLTVPIYAILGRLVFLKNKTFNYTELLVVFMYILAQTSILTSLFTIVGSVFGISMGNISFAILPFQIIYSAYCLKKLYGLNLSQIILKTLLFIGVSVFLYIIFIIAFFLLLYITENQWFLDFMEKQKELHRK